MDKFNTFVLNNQKQIIKVKNPSYLIFKKVFFFLTLSLFLNSCVVEVETGGCIEPSAYNYSSTADFDDGSCKYTSDVVFYEDVAAAVYFNALGVEWLDLYVDGDYIGTLDATLGLTYIPNCNEVDAVSFSLEWQNNLSSSFSWVIRDENGFMHYDGVEAILPNDCLPIGLTFKKIQEYKASK